VVHTNKRCEVNLVFELISQL